MTPLLEVDRLVKDFKGRSGFGRSAETVRAVDEVSFAVPEHGSVAVVGESGSGKTTTARIVVGLESATAGRVSFRGQALDPNPGPAARRARAREIQMVFQNPFGSLDPRQTANDAIAEVLEFHRLADGSARRDRVAELLDQVGLDRDDAGRRPRELSGGQCQRVAIARALALEPELLILDEAVSALDVSTQAQILNLLVSLREQLSLTMLMISHDLAVVRQIADEVVVMYRGKAVERGAVDKVLSDPEHEYTKRLLASVPQPGVLVL
jgi:oligopeptide transport system ATP-binding protein